MIEPTPLTQPVARPPVQRWRLVVAISAEDGDGARQARQAAWDAGLGGCGLPVAGLDANPPKVRLMPAAPLSPSIAGEAELVDIWLVERLPRWRVREALVTAMPAGHRLVDVHDVWLGEAPLPGRVVGSVYRVELSPDRPAGPVLRDAAAAMLAAPTLRRERRKGEGLVGYDLRPFLEDLDVVDGPVGGRPALRMTLRHDPERGIGRPDEVLAEIGDRIGVAVTAVTVVRERLVLGPERPAPVPSAAPARRGAGIGTPAPGRRR